MPQPLYPLSPARIGNSSGFRLPASFYRDHPEFVNATGQVQVIAKDTLLVKLERVDTLAYESEDDLMLSLFLDIITKAALRDPSHLEAYTEAMAQEDDDLLTGIEIDP